MSDAVPSYAMLATQFIAHEPLVPKSMTFKNMAAHLAGEPFELIEFDIANHENPHLRTLALALCGDARFGDADAFTFLLEMIAAYMHGYFLAKMPDHPTQETVSAMMWRVERVIDWVVQQH